MDRDGDGDTERKMGTAQRRLRAFVVSNATAVASAVPTLVVVAWRASAGAGGRGADAHLALLYLATVARLLLAVAVLSLKQPKERVEDADTRAASLARLLAVAAPIETVLTLYAMGRWTDTSGTRSTLASVLGFTPLLLAFEVLMDLGHYLAHRACHAHPLLYRLSGHKQHHAVSRPTPLATFMQDPADVLFTNFVPVVAALAVLDCNGWGVRFTPTQLVLALGYKSWLEVAGHVGDVDGHASSFPLFVFLPRWLGMELRTRDHDWHHTGGGRTNFSKRFKLWDVVFGTYFSPALAREGGGDGVGDANAKTAGMGSKRLGVRSRSTESATAVKRSTSSVSSSSSSLTAASAPAAFVESRP